MSETTLAGIRNLWAEVTTTPETMTAHEMALIAHNLDRSGDKSKCKDGRVFVWAQNKGCWVRVH